jgi:hypothetical protein
VNINEKDFSSFQLGFLNTAGGDFDGVQAGFLNIVGDNFAGVQLGCVNITGGAFDGVQAGFLNIVGDNFAGVQLGLINYAESAENLLPIGLVSIVRNGGYQALEYTFSEFYPINVGIKTGLEKLYTTIFIAYDPRETLANFGGGVGLGTILPLSGVVYFNPEIHQVYSHDKWLMSLVPYFGCSMGNISIVAGPSVTWVRAQNGGTIREPSFAIVNHALNDKNSLVVAVRAGLRYRF